MMPGAPVIAMCGIPHAAIRLLRDGITRAVKAGARRLADERRGP
jgi:hypothetical protein